MKTELALKLLVDVMGWQDLTAATEEIGKIEYLANVKYDTYRNFEPGRRFLESLTLWLRQFATLEERRIAYDFVMHRMLYVSEVQIDHLVGLLYPQRALPIILKQACEATGYSPYQVRRIRSSDAFKAIQRKTLFLGMSDGARMDAFRRKNALHNDQVSVSYELNLPKWERMHEALEKDLKRAGYDEHACFENIFLVDDFSGSGNSILKIQDGEFKGKLWRFVDDALGCKAEPKCLGKLCNRDGPRLYIVTYIAGEQAIADLRQRVDSFLASDKKPHLSSCEILDPLQMLNRSLTIPQSGNDNDELFDEMLFDYYDSRIEDEHTRTGGKNVIHGYAECALPLVLSHNCPNNSVYLLWAQAEKTDDCPGLKGLFPRTSRHMEGR